MLADNTVTDKGDMLHIACTTKFTMAWRNASIKFET